ncbi:cytotoxic and regulatory T-cell molecule [Pyrgilauda ruficollis]|uniref:cytotoxic and regulatory T-cell molecule n=1 Tax=Pyrgilauda ruficollis TaxID=221976 RepID=UPI001B8634DA|nr:cytotoxic and regulatory T-cell molecule [Pyrgilauda ruficollis]
MSVPGALLTVPLLLLQGGFPGAASDSVTLKQGENLNLNCTFSTLSNDNFTLQWVNPKNFTIFLNAQQAAPSHPVLEVSQDKGRGIKLSCYTQGGRPQPQISWLLDNGIELPGDTRHQLGADGKKWSTRSTLRILSYSPRGTASCIIQHPALGARRLLASFPFQDLPSSENDVSQQTLESYKSRSNEDSPGHEKNGQAGNPKSNLQYVTEGHVETPEKNLETPEKNPKIPAKSPGAPGNLP